MVAGRARFFHKLVVVHHRMWRFRRRRRTQLTRVWWPIARDFGRHRVRLGWRRETRHGRRREDGRGQTVRWWGRGFAPARRRRRLVLFLHEGGARGSEATTVLSRSGLVGDCFGRRRYWHRCWCYDVVGEGRMRRDGTQREAPRICVPTCARGDRRRNRDSRRAHRGRGGRLRRGRVRVHERGRTRSSGRGVGRLAQGRARIAIQIARIAQRAEARGRRNGSAEARDPAVTVGICG
jgi:hypothetical protein